MIQLQLSQLSNNTNNNANIPCQCQDPTICQHIKTFLPLTNTTTNSSTLPSTNTTWNLTISNNHRGIQLQTSIQSMSDLSFLSKKHFLFLYMEIYYQASKISQKDGILSKY